MQRKGAEGMRPRGNKIINGNAPQKPDTLEFSEAAGWFGTLLIAIHDAVGLSRNRGRLFLKISGQRFIDHSCWESRSAEGCQSARMRTFAEGVGEGLWRSQTFNLTPVFLCACSFAEKLLRPKEAHVWSRNSKSLKKKNNL